ncbi:MAG: MFS transporter, partial [Candidatus Binatia bacterium]
GVFFHPLSEHFGWSRAQISWGFSFVSVLGALVAPLLGRIVDRRGPRPVQIFGAVMLGLGYLALAGIGSLWQYYACMGLLVAAGSAALGPVSSNTAVARWFVRRRGTALGISTAGISMGGVIFVPLTQFLIDRVGWRGAFLGIAMLVVLVGVPPIALWMRRSPEEMGLAPDGDVPRERLDTGDLEAELERSVTAADAIRSPNFWLLAVAFALTISGLSAILLHQIPYMIDQGMDPGLASWVLGGTAGVGVVGKLGFGALLDRFDERRVILFCFLLQAVGVALLFFADEPWMLVLYVIVYGYSMGGNATLQATSLGKVFGRLHYGSIAGRMSPIIVGFQSAGVPLVGWLHDRTGSYALAFWTVIAATLLAAACIWNVGFPADRSRGA